jgi:hypothetical protein
MTRPFPCALLIVIMVTSLVASAADGAMLFGGKGSVLLNHVPLPNHMSAIFPGDLIETGDNSAASIDGSGWGIALLPNSRLKYQNNLIVLEHGVISAGTYGILMIRAGCISASAASRSQSDWTEFEVWDTSGTIRIVARKRDVYIEEQSVVTKVSKSSNHKTKPSVEKRFTLPEGMQTTRDENCKKENGAPPAAQGSVLSSPYTKAIAAAALAGGVIYLLDPDPRAPASPFVP